MSVWVFIFGGCWEVGVGVVMVYILMIWLMGGGIWLFIL